MYEVRDISLAPSGERKIKWVERNMPILGRIAEEFRQTRPFEGLRVALSVHMEAKTAWLCRVMAMGGAEMHVTGCNPLSTQDDVAAAVAAGGIDVHAWHGATEEEYTSHLCAVLESRPNIIIDDGGDLVHLMHTKYTDYIPDVIGGCEETTTGIHRLKAMAARGELRFPMVMVNEADCKHLFDNRYGTGQSVWDGINRTTNLIVAGKCVVVAGYGWCGKGVSMRAKGMGAKVIVTEVDPVKAIEAVMDGFEVMSMDEAAAMSKFSGGRQSGANCSCRLMSTRPREACRLTTFSSRGSRLRAQAGRRHFRSRWRLLTLLTSHCWVTPPFSTRQRPKPVMLNTMYVLPKKKRLRRLKGQHPERSPDGPRQHRPCPKRLQSCGPERDLPR